MDHQERHPSHLQPDRYGLCSNCENEDHLWAIPPFPGGSATYPRYLCKSCFESDNPYLSLGDKCRSCGCWDQLIDCSYYQEDQSKDRLKYSPFLTKAQQEIYFYDQGPMGATVCRKCKEADSYLLTDEELNTVPVRPVARLSDEPIPYYQPEVDLLNEFQDRALLHDLGVVFAKDLFKAAGYEVTSSGVEDLHPELLGILPHDENSSLARLRSNPDLYVLDRPARDLFRVECKITAVNPMDIKLPTQVVERMRIHHPNSVLWLHHLPSSYIRVLKIRDVDWDERPVETSYGKPFYLLGFHYPTPANPDPVHWRQPEEIFSRLTPELVQSRSDSWREVLRQHYVGRELKDRFNQASIIGV